MEQAGPVRRFLAMIQHGGTIRSRGSGPWLGLFMTAVLVVIAVIAGLTLVPGPTLESPQVLMDAPQIPAPAAPSAMR